jgi:histidine ammonia-lyase
MNIVLNGSDLTLDQIHQLVVNPSATISLSAEAISAMNRSRALVDQWVDENKIVYGVTTGFGEFANVFISKDQREELQENLILSHSAGTGNFLPDYIVRTIMLLRINALAKGHSGIRVSTVETLVSMYNNHIIPAVPEQGSVGSSGDLVQLSHIALALIGKGTIQKDGKYYPSADVLKQHNLQPVRLTSKEGLALINGTQMMGAFGSIAVLEAQYLATIADISGAMTADALRSTDRAFDERIHNLRGFDGQKTSAKNLRTLLKNSQIRESHREGDSRVQDAYSIRCMPQVHGASRDAINYVFSVLSKEINAANDNPLIFPDSNEYLEGGNFHGQPLALALDFLAIACAELANISERRIERLVNGALSGLPRFLATKGGVQSGMMIAQYSAASLVSENKVLCHPASVDSIPTSANQEDHNSMGSIAAQKCLKVVDNLRKVLAIELLCATQAIDFLRPLRSSESLENVYAEIRKLVPFAETDRIIYHDIKAIETLLESKTLPSIASIPVDLVS